jgi:hypothetical protein
MNQLIKSTKADISKPAEFAKLVAAVNEVQGQINEFWGFVEQQMLDRNVKKLTGSWGKIAFEQAELLIITDASLLDSEMIKPALNTQKVRDYRGLFNELPAGVSTKTITKFTKRIK